jgi:hypothetical protein
VKWDSGVTGGNIEAVEKTPQNSDMKVNRWWVSFLLEHVCVPAADVETCILTTETLALMWAGACMFDVACLFLSGGERLVRNEMYFH